MAAALILTLGPILVIGLGVIVLINYIVDEIMEQMFKGRV